MANRKCKLLRNIARPCDTLTRSLHNSDLGVTEKFIFDFKSGAAVYSVFVLHSGQFRKKGIVLNFCPFCGMAIFKQPAKGDVT